MAAPDDFAAHVEVRWTEGWLAALDGRREDALRRMDEAFEYLRGTDYLGTLADTHRYRGEVLLVLGDHESARNAFEEAIGFWDRKGNVTAARRMRERLAGSAR